MHINLSSEVLYFGVPLGFKLSRLEWLWGSKFDFAQKEFESSKANILSQLPIEDIHIDDVDFVSFSQSIINYYLRTDIATYSAILIGISIQRCLLVGASKDSTKNEELLALSKSTLKSIPSMIVPNKEHLFDLIYKHKTEDLFEILACLEQLLNFESKEENVSQTESKIKPTLFLSYCSKDSSIADIIESQLKYETNNGIEISRYTRVPYKGSFKAFMNEIQDHDFVLCLVSDNYLKSQACMYEVGEIIKDHHFHEKLLFVVISENDRKYFVNNIENFAAAKIYGNVKNRLSYIQYWKNEYESFKEAIREINDSVAVICPSEELKEIKRIYEEDIGEFLKYLSDKNGKNFEELYNDKFSDIIKWIFPDWQSRLFVQCKSFSELLANTLEMVWKTTQTDYNQISLVVTTSSHNTGLMVYADNICSKKQKYRLVTMEGLMGNAFSTGKIINIGDIRNEPGYFMAVSETKSELVVPIEFQGNIIGVINSESEKDNFYSETIVKQICKIANDFSIAVSRLGYVRNIAHNEIPYIHIEFR